VQIAVRECLLLFGAESFIFQFAVQKYKGPGIWNYNFAFVLYGCDTLSPTVSEEHTLRGFGNGVLRKVFRPMRKEVTGEWGRWHNEILYDLYSSNMWVIKTRRMWWVGHVAHMGKRRGAYRILVGRPVVRKPVGRPRLG